MTIRRARRQGFTLVEVLVAVTLFALIMVGLVGGMRTLATSADAVDERSREMDDMRVVQDFLARAFDLHRPIAVGQGRDVRPAFTGEAERLAWSGALPARHAPHGLFWLRLELDRRAATGDQHPLTLCYAPLPAGAVVASLPQDCERHVLQPKVEVFEVAYREPGGATWLESWADPARMPAAIRVRVKAGGRWWPEQILRPNGHPE
ncbi:prepilin-type N-terminal cleavage/methylation domain-containing protein [Thioalkalivibrio paradoxus]|uniref:Type II secretion system protein J n=1 Tax=Thioalkalivibrio paradoxus ARh 1 TaxID=713585 RepID=W0DTD3_9GAMM|nr:prepilin-type N-terminal cleavage/methylation domain-containing protein [Thioalkalivibrio paradoxus]AHF00141.1 hypothetical protein THITH_10185 [Thioalkalivibrio paradoxus ARh 1]